MKTNKKLSIGILSCALVVTTFFATPSTAKAGFLVPFIDPITGLIIADAFTCDINIIWGCDAQGHPLPHVSLTASPATVYVGDPITFSWDVAGVSACTTSKKLIPVSAGDNDRTFLIGDVTNSVGSATMLAPLESSSPRVYRYMIGCVRNSDNSFYSRSVDVNVINHAACGPMNGTFFASDSYAVNGFNSSFPGNQCKASSEISTNTTPPVLDGAPATWQCVDLLGGRGPICSASLASGGCSLPGGISLRDGYSTTAYVTSSVPCGSTCTAQTLTCNAGVISNGSLWHCDGANQDNQSDCEDDDGTWVIDNPIAQNQTCSVDACVATPTYTCVNPAPTCPTTVGSVGCVDSLGISVPLANCSGCTAKTTTCSAPSSSVNVSGWKEVTP